MGLIEVRAKVNDDARNVPMHSLAGQNGAGTELAADRLFLKEIVRQSTVFNIAFERAWLRAINPATPYQDVEVLADIQSALFAAIITRRILSPEGVKKHPRHDHRADSQRWADERAARLREHLGIRQESPIIAVTDVRNSYEHIDERIDVLTTGGDAASVTDWSISDGTAFNTIRDESGVHHRLRVFYPAGGVLFYDNQLIDLYHLDLEMLALRTSAESGALPALTSAGTSQDWLFGATQVVHLMSPDRVRPRYEDWVRSRTGLGEPISTDFHGAVPSTK